jgi:hypothetical protein
MLGKAHNSEETGRHVMERIVGKLDVVKLMREQSRKVSVPTSQRHKNKKRQLRADATGRKTVKHKKKDW